MISKRTVSGNSKHNGHKRGEKKPEEQRNAIHCVTSGFQFQSTNCFVPNINEEWRRASLLLGIVVILLLADHQGNFLHAILLP